VLTFTTIFITGSVVSNIQYARHWQVENPAPDYFDRIEKSLSDRQRPVPLADMAVPRTIMWGFRFPENTYSHVFRLYEDETRYPKHIDDELFMFDRQGNVRPALISTLRRNAPPPDEGCGYRLEDEGISIPLDEPVTGDGWWVRLGYLADGDSPITVTAGRWVHDAQVKEGLHSLFFRAGGDFDRIRLSGLEDGVSLCTNDVTLGLPQPFKPR
jgi:hypothetical protein